MFAYSIWGLVSRLSLLLDSTRHPHHHGGRCRSSIVGLEEAARSLGASPWAVQRDVVLPALKPAFIASGRDCVCHRNGGVRYGIYARHQYRCAADADLHRVHTRGEPLDRRRRCRSVSESSHGRSSRLRARLAAAPWRRRDNAMRDRLIFTAQLGLHAAGGGLPGGTRDPVDLSRCHRQNIFVAFSPASPCNGSSRSGTSMPKPFCCRSSSRSRRLR